MPLGSVVLVITSAGFNVMTTVAVSDAVRFEVAVTVAVCAPATLAGAV